MSGRHSGRTGPGSRIFALPKTLRVASRLAPRQIIDEIALAKVEIKRKGTQLGISAAFFAVALVFIGLLVIGLVVAGIMGLATVMAPWLAALLVCGAFLVIALIGGLIGLQKFKKAMPLLPEEAIRGFKHDLGIAKYGSDFNAAVLDPSTPEAKAAKAAKAAKSEEAAKVKAENASKADSKAGELPAPTEAELRHRLIQRRQHLTAARDELSSQLNVKVQAKALLDATQSRLKNGKERLNSKVDSSRASVRATQSKDVTVSGWLGGRWKPLLALAASATALVVLLRKLVKG